MFYHHDVLLFRKKFYFVTKLEKWGHLCPVDTFLLFNPTKPATFAILLFWAYFRGSFFLYSDNIVCLECPEVCFSFQITMFIICLCMYQPNYQLWTYILNQVCQTKPECGRQSLTELLIRPVQRLPSITLLLNGKFTLHNYFTLFTKFYSVIICTINISV